MMIHDDAINIYFLLGDSSIPLINNFIKFLSPDVNFLYLDTTRDKDLSKYSINHQYVFNDANFIDTIQGNMRNLDHIILFIPNIYKQKYLPNVKKMLDSVNVPYSIITSIHNRSSTDGLGFESVYFVHKDLIEKKGEIIKYDSFTIEYNRTVTINNIINS